MTLGETRVRTKFNVSESEKDLVDAIKQRSAKLIDLVDKEITLSTERFKQNEDGVVGELIRLKALAMTHYETAAMYAVKAATI